MAAASSPFSALLSDSCHNKQENVRAL